MAASSKGLTQRLENDGVDKLADDLDEAAAAQKEEEDEAAAKAQTKAWSTAAPLVGKRKRLKREAYLACVRSRLESRRRDPVLTGRPLTASHGASGSGRWRPKSKIALQQ